MKQNRRILAALLLLLLIPAGFARDILPGGAPIGIRIQTGGLVVAGLSGVKTETGSVSPGKDAGLLPGDVILSINDQPIHSDIELTQLLQTLKKTTPLRLQIQRGGEPKTTRLNPVRGADGTMKIGLMVRDSISGIGTLTFYDPETGLFGSLGHGISNGKDDLVPLLSGDVLYAEVDSVRKGEPGDPGELRGKFPDPSSKGELLENNDKGLFGTIADPQDVGLTASPVPVSHEVQLGAATILCNVKGKEIREYDIEIIKIYSQTESKTRNFMIRITDLALLEQTGGIVQGMSGSPVLQNGKLCGAVTHVLVGDPKRGYGILIDHMLDVTDGLNTDLKDAA